MKREPVEHYYRFAVVGICNLYVLILLAAHFFPRQFSLEEMMAAMAMNQNPQPRSQLERFLDSFRNPQGNPKSG